MADRPKQEEFTSAGGRRSGSTGHHRIVPEQPRSRDADRRAQERQDERRNARQRRLLHTNTISAVLAALSVGVATVVAAGWVCS